MRPIDRRTLLCGVTIGVLAAASRSPAARGFPTERPPPGVLTRLPGNGNQLALTIDDGASAQVVGAFADFCRDSGTRVTFFVNAANSSWSVNAPALRPMVDSGQVQLGNHTWSHPDITRIAPGAVADQIRRNADFLRNTYGVDGTPYFRPPWGKHTPATDRIAAANRSFQPQQIVVGHANLPTITHCFGQLLDIVRSRNLQTVTLNDVFT